MRQCLTKGLKRNTQTTYLYWVWSTYTGLFDLVSLRRRKWRGIEQHVWREAQVGIVIGEHRLIKEGRRAGERLLGTVLLGHTHTDTHTQAYTHTYYMYTKYIHTHTRTQTLLQASETLRDIMCYGIGGRYGRMAFLIKTIRSLIALGFHLILRH